MPLTNKEVDHVAKLARLGLSDEERKLYQDQLSRILDYARRINELTTVGVEPTFHSLPLNNVFRPDRVAQRVDPAEVLKAAPALDHNSIPVPRILE